TPAVERPHKIRLDRADPHTPALRDLAHCSQQIPVHSASDRGETVARRAHPQIPAADRVAEHALKTETNERVALRAGAEPLAPGHDLVAKEGVRQDHGRPRAAAVEYAQARIEGVRRRLPAARRRARLRAARPDRVATSREPSERHALRPEQDL